MTATSSLWQRLMARYDETRLVKAVFFGMLAGAIGVVMIDYRDMRAAQPLVTPQTMRSVPVLPSARPQTDGPETARPGSVTTPADTHRAPMTFTLARDGVLKATGSVMPGTAQNFISQLEQIGEYVELVSLDSPGGSLEDALSIGAAIREAGLTTLVEDGALCACACPVILAGGTQRRAEPDAAIGVHQIYLGGETFTSAGDAMAAAQTTTARVTRYLEEMGVDPAVWTHALETPPRQLYYLTAEEMAEYDLVGASIPES
jgi:hypothetical protein